MKPVPKPIYQKAKRVRAPRIKNIESLPLEESEQQAVSDWLDAKGIIYQASSMGAFLHPSTFYRMQKIGCKPGFPDLMIYSRPPKQPDKPGIAIEMKRRKGGVVSPLQVIWHEQLKELGWLVHVCCGADAAIEVLKSYGY